MKDRGYWTTHYVVETDVAAIERGLLLTSFASGGKDYELVYFTAGKRAPCILISQGSGGHAYVFAELGYRLHQQGFNVFIMPKHGGYTISELMARQRDALTHIAHMWTDRIGIFSEGLGGFVSFYLALAHGPFQSLVCQNAPAILTEPAYQAALMQGRGAARRRQLIIPAARLLLKLLPRAKLPITLYLDWRELIDPSAANRLVETRLVVDGYLHDPDFDQWYPLAAIMSLLTTPPPCPLTELTTPTMFLLATRGIIPGYIEGLYHQLPPIEKRLVKVDGGVYWMLSHPVEAAQITGAWFAHTL